MSLISASAAYAVPSGAPDAGAYATNGPVTAIAHGAGRTYVGGLFTRVGRRSGSGVSLSPLGAPGSFPEVAGGDVRAVVSDGAGGWFIGGDFTAVAGQRRIALAHVHGDGSLDPNFTPVATDIQGNPAAVNALELSPAADGKRTLYVGGEFSLIGVGDVGDLEFHTNIAALNAADGEAITEFGPTADCRLFADRPCPVNALELVHVPLPVTVDGSTSDRDQPLLFVGGSFTSLGPSDALQDVSGVGAVWGATSVDSENVPNAGALVRTTSGAPWKPAFTGSAHTLQAGPWTTLATAPTLALYAGGQGTQAGPPIAKAFQFRISSADNRRDRVANSASPFSNWKPDPGCDPDDDCAVRAMALDGSHLRFGGDFTTPAGRLATIASIPDPTITTFAPTPAAAFGPGFDGPVEALALSAPDPTTLFVGGGFDGGIMALNAASGARSASWTPPAPDAPVHALATSALTPAIYAGGEFRSLDSRKRNGLAAFDAAGTLLDWAPDVSFDDSLPLVYALAASDRTVYVGGQFDAIGGAGGANLVGVDVSSGSVQALAEPSSTSGEAAVLSLSLLGSTLYAGGAFDHVGEQLRDNLAAVDVTTNSLLGWGNPGARGNDAIVYSVLPACGAVYVGGWFQELGGQPRENLAGVDPSSGAANAWHPRPDGAVLALARSGRTIYAAGTFTEVTGAARQKVAALDAGNAAPTEFNAGIDATSIGASVWALAVSDSALYLGGIFTSVHGQTRSNLAAVNPATGQPTGWDPSADGPVEALAVIDDSVYAGGSFASLGTTAQSGLARFGSGAGSPFTSTACSFPSASADPDSPPPNPPSTTPVDAGGTTARTGAPSASSEIGRVTVTPTRLRLGRRALTVRFRLSRRMPVRLRFQRRVRRRCPARSARPARRRACFRYVRFADATARGKAGLNRISFPGQRVGRRRLVPGAYRIELASMSPARAAARRLAYFKVIRNRNTRKLGAR